MNAQQTIDWQARAEKAEWELERVRKQASAMRDALQSLISARVECVDGKPATHAWLGPESRKRINDALSGDAGANYFSKEQVQTFVDIELSAAYETSGSLIVECGELKAELDRVQKQAAAMRHALKQFTSTRFGRSSGLVDIDAHVQGVRAICELALTDDAGANYVSKEQVKLLMEALNEYRAVLYSEGFSTAPAELAIHHARSLGL